METKIVDIEMSSVSKQRAWAWTTVRVPAAWDNEQIKEAILDAVENNDHYCPSVDDERTETLESGPVQVTEITESKKRVYELDLCRGRRLT
jgi:hypothetical protein